MRRGLAVFALIALVARASAADGPDAASAAELKQRGVAAMDALRYDEAIDDFTRAYALLHDPALLYNRGRARQARGEFPEALSDIEQFGREASPELRARVPKLDALLAELRSHVARLAVTSSVEGARVVVRGKDVGTTPLPAPLSLPAGPARVEVRAEGYFDWHRELTLTAGVPTTLDAVLSPRSSSGVLRVQATAPGTRIFVDDQPLGTSPAETSVPAGTHRVLAHAEGYEDQSTSVVIAAGETKDVAIEPEARPSILARWWFWTGVGIVVAAGGVTTYALLTEKPAGHGSFQPGQVSAPLTRW
jgi:hypothetical protein